jgi:uncharacterized protein YndB with AHSA1/START domain
MSTEWHRKFEISVPVERVWSAVTNPDELGVLMSPPENPVTVQPQSTALSRINVLQATENELLRWSMENEEKEVVAEFTMVFESTETGSRISVTRFGFGEDEESDIFSEAHTLSWSQAMRDLVLYLETGHIARRHYNGCFRSAMGVMYKETDFGPEVRGVDPGSFGEQAGLERGDRIVRLADNAVFNRADIWQQIGMREPGSEITVEFIRDRELMSSGGKLISAKLRAIGE